MVTVVDSIMGSGKTSWAIQYMNDNPEKSFLYITPFLKEIERIEKVSSIEIFQPNNSNGNRKLNNLNDLLAIGKNIGATHELFKHLNNESLKLIRDNNYILIMDEALDVVVPLNIFKTDVELLISNGDLTISDKGYAIWSGDEDYKGRFKDIKNAAKKHQLICVNNSILYWQ